VQNDERVAMLRRTYDAFNRRDIDAVLATLTPDVDWPNMMDNVRAHGHDEVRAYWERQFEEIDSHVEPTDIVGDGDRYVVAVHQVVRDRNGNVLNDSHIAHAYVFKGDLVASMHVHPSVDDALRYS
jgi:hypothetical protein